MYCNVLVTKPFDQTFTYKKKVDQKVKIGSVVNVPFGNKNKEIGIVYGFSEIKPNKIKKIKIKEIDSVFNEILLNKNIIKFLDWIANYTLAPKGLVLKLFLVNQNIISHKIEKDNNIDFNFKNITLNPEQKKSFDFINKKLFKTSTPIVLEGVTGSGKTEVYFEAIEKVIKKKKQVLIMLPEISLTPQFEIRFKARFGFTPHVWHSKIAIAKRKMIWHKCYKDKSLIVVGARSSLFLPFNNLGLIVVDEEHDLSFKQEDNIRYQARDLAIVRSNIEKFPIILSSATPSIETENNIRKKKFHHTFLPSQYSGTDLPEITLINMGYENLEKNKWISNKILQELQKVISAKQQALLFLNRRGYSPLRLCKDCGYRSQCDHCSSWLVMHRDKNRMLCHHCGTIYPNYVRCPNCQKKDSFKYVGPGVERLAEEVKEIFPKYNVEVMSSDIAGTPLKIKKIIDKFEKKQIDILVATQIFSKGYHFPNLSMVGVIDADAGLMGGDIKAIEKTYNLLQQVSGRAGRSEKIGKVLIQTFFPNQPIMKSLQKRNRKEFIDQCLSERMAFNTPPFSSMTAIIVSSSSRSKAESYSNQLVRTLQPDGKISILGPVEAQLFLLRGQYRYRILLKANNRRLLNNFTRILMKNCPPPSNLRLIVDVDPYSFT